MSHPLDRAIWSALTTRQSPLALGDPASALRFQPDYGMFVASADGSVEARRAMAALLTGTGAAEVEISLAPPAPGCVVVSEAQLDQMILERLNARPSDQFDIIPLSDSDAPEMRALAELTKPGPFFSRTHQLGDFVGVKQDGKLIAMAGERMKPAGFTEVSAVCTHPDARGRGLARVLMQHVIAKILARGEAAFLHTYSNNAGAISLYESLGFRRRASFTMRVMKPA